jgi:SAM-dependent methyltransferase
VTDTSLPIPPDSDADRILAAFDVEGKIPRSLEALGPVADRDVVLLDAGGGHLARRLASLGARLTLVDRPRADREPHGPGDGPATDGPATDGPGSGLPPGVTVVAGEAAATGLPEASADAIVVAYSAFRGPSPDEVVEADRVLRDGGRLLVVHDYGRDDHVLMRPEIADDAFAWSRRDGWFLTHGFRIRVLHCFWTFADLDEARELLELAFGPAGSTFADGLARPRVSHNIAVYHRSRHGSGPSPVERRREGPARRQRSHPDAEPASSPQTGATRDGGRAPGAS